MKEVDFIFIDTNILVYLFDLTDPKKQKKALNVIAESNTIISVQVVNEFINVVTSKIQIPIDFDNIHRILEEFETLFHIADLSFLTSQKAVKLKNKYNYSLWDSMILASALENNCCILYSEDMQHGQKIYNKLKIINPF